jgi:diguanylate cyclase (GGDEF)-like protein
VLREFGALLLGQLRSQVDWVARYGGEEFLIVLPESDLPHAQQAAERLRERWRRSRWIGRAFA